MDERQPHDDRGGEEEPPYPVGIHTLGFGSPNLNISVAGHRSRVG
jgi:hypothetical protein